MRAYLFSLIIVLAGISAPSAHAQQVESYRVIELEETVRRLNGQVEELQFQLLQLQEKLRKMEEDNEARFQEIEEKQSSVAPSTSPAGSETTELANSGETPRLEKPEPSGQDQAPDGNQPAQNETASTTENSPREVTTGPRKLGTLTFDREGNVITKGDVGSEPRASNDNPFTVPFSTGTEGAAEASEFGTTPNEVLDIGIAAFNRRNYPRAAAALSAHVKAWPNDTKSGEARYFLAQSLFWQQKYYDAAEIHLETHNEFPTSAVAAENLLGLGLSLAGLNQRETACATYAEVLTQYPDAKARLGEQVEIEQATARC